jgi:predicted nucleic acid-binding Zn ribbon protein
MTTRLPRKMGSLLDNGLLKRLGVPADVSDLAAITLAWRAVVGEPLASHVYPIRCHEGTLVLRAGSALWVNKVRHQQQTLLAQLREHSTFREMTALEIRVAAAERPVRAQSERSALTLSAGTRQLLSAVAGDIADPELRAALERLAGPRGR